MIKKMIIVLCCLVLLVLPTSALLNISVNSQTKNSISWNWSEQYVLTGLSIDGYQVVLFDKNTSQFDLTGLNPNEKHSIKIYMGLDNVTNTTTTLDAGLQSQLVDNTLAIILGYIFFIAAILCVIIGRWVRVLAWIGVGLSCIGIVSMIDVSFWAGFVFMVVFCAGVLVALSPE